MMNHRDPTTTTDAALDTALDAVNALAEGVIPPALAQQPDETALAYQAFLLYLKLGRKRSIRQVAQLDGHDERHTERWASKHQWTDRAALYDRLVLRAQLLDLLPVA
jgi:hypothetical protein